MSQKAYNTITLRRLPSGETVNIALSSNRSLTILVSKTTRKQSPVLSNDSPIILTPRVYSTTGNTAELTDIHWTMNDIDVAASLGSIATVNPVTGTLTIHKSPIGVVVQDNALSPVIIKFSATAKINGHNYKVEKLTSLDFPEVSENSYWGSIEASNGTTLDDDNKSTTLTPRLYLNTELVTDYTVKWFKTGGNADGTDQELKTSEPNKWTLTGKTLTVYRDGVDSAAHFECHFYTQADGEVEAEGVAIIDIADSIQVILSGDTYISENDDAKITIRAVDTKTQADYHITKDDVRVVVTDSLRQRTYNAAYYSLTSDGSGTALFAMNERYWRVPYSDFQKVNEWAVVGKTSAADTLTSSLTDATRCEIILLVEVTLNI